MKQKAQLQQTELTYQKEVLRSVIESQEAERMRIGRDLHDDVGTALSNLRITIERFSREKLTENSFKELKTISKKIIDQVIADVRSISHNLSPEILTVNSASEAIEELCDFLSQSGKIEIDLNLEAAGVLDALPLTSALSIYRVLEELMTNTVRHAEASKATISFSADNRKLVVDYRDDGKGLPKMETVKKGRGIRNIESRLEIIQASHILKSNDGKGYHMKIEIPV